MSDRITGRQARELLDGITGGQWFCYHDMDAEEGEPVSTLQTEYPDSDIAPVADGDGVRNPADGRLLAHAPDLAETVAWLYGRPSDETVPGDEHWDTEGFLVEVRDGRVAMFDDEATTTYLSVDQTVDLARALLAAAEEARGA